MDNNSGHVVLVLHPTWSTTLNRNFKNGYLIFPSAITGNKLALYKGVLESLTQQYSNHSLTSGWNSKSAHADTEFVLCFDKDGKPIPGKLSKIQGVGLVDPRILEMLSEPCIVDKVKALLQSQSLDVFGTKFYPLLPEGGTSVGWHQDNYYFGTTAESTLSCVIYFEETDKTNGCLRILPGSHKDGIVKHTPGSGIFTFGEWATISKEQEQAVVDVVCTPGTVVLFSANVLHAAYPNLSKDHTSYRVACHWIPGDQKFGWRGTSFNRGEYKDRHIIVDS